MFVGNVVVAVQKLGRVWLFVTPWTAAQGLLYLTLSPGVCSNSCPLIWWYHPTVLSSAALFSFCLQSFPASESFPMIWLFSSSGQSVGVSASASILSVNIQGWFLLELAGLISLQSKGLSRIFSKTTILANMMQLFLIQPKTV